MKGPLSSVEKSVFINEMMKILFVDARGKDMIVDGVLRDLSVCEDLTDGRTDRRTDAIWNMTVVNGMRRFEFSMDWAIERKFWVFISCLLGNQGLEIRGKSLYALSLFFLHTVKNRSNKLLVIFFLDEPSHLYKRVCPSVRRSDGSSPLYPALSFRYR